MKSEPSNLQTSVLRGVKWQAGAVLGRQLLSWMAGVILARLLQPTDFGLVAMAAIFVEIASSLKEGGLGPAIIQKQNLDTRHLTAAFWLAALLGLITAGLLLIATPLIAVFYHQKAIAAILQVLCLAVFLGGFNVVPGYVLRRTFDFRRVAIADMGATLISGTTSIGLAAYGLGAISLPLGSVAGLVFAMLAYWTMMAWRPSWRWRLSDLRGSWGFTLNATAAQVMNLTCIFVDNLLVGKFLGAAALGIYALSYNLVTMPEYRLVGLISGVAFPAFARLQEESDALRSHFLKMTCHVTLWVFPMLLGLQAVSDDLIKVIYGDKWLGAVPVLRVLCLAGIATALTAMMEPVLMASGRADTVFKTKLLWLGFLLAALALTVPRGLVAVAWGVTISAWIACVVRLAMVLRLLHIRWLTCLKEAYPNALAALFMIGVLYGIRALAGAAPSPGLHLLGEVLLGAIIYSGMQYLINAKTVAEFFSWTAIAFRRS